MKIYTKIVLDKDNNLLEEKSYDYQGNIASAMGIHYDFKSTKSTKLMEKQAKREKKLAERKRKRLEKEGPKEEEPKEKAMNTSTPLSLEAITNPDKE